MRLDWKGGLGVGVTVFLLWWVLREVDLVQVWTEIQGANFFLLAVAVTISTVTFFLRALRWKVILAPIHPGTTLRSRFAAVNIGFMANNLLPARVGEFARAYALSRMEPIPVTGAFASLFVERFLDGLAIVSLMFLAMASPGFPSEIPVGDVSLDAVIRWVMIILGCLLAFMAFLLLFPGPLLKVGESLARVLPQRMGEALLGAIQSFVDGLRVFQSPKLLALAVGWSFLTWSWHSLGFWVAFRAFDIHVGYDAALFVNAIVGFWVGLPAAPGFFGTFHAGAKMGLGVYGIPAAPTLAFAFGFHLGGFFPVTFIGLYYAWKMGLSLKEMGGGDDASPSPSETPGVRDTIGVEEDL